MVWGQVYDLFAVVLHSGGPHSGHYHAYIRDMMREGNWVAASDVTLPTAASQSSGCVQGCGWTVSLPFPGCPPPPSPSRRRPPSTQTFSTMSLATHALWVTSCPVCARLAWGSPSVGGAASADSPLPVLLNILKRQPVHNTFKKRAIRLGELGGEVALDVGSSWKEAFARKYKTMKVYIESQVRGGTQKGTWVGTHALTRPSPPTVCCGECVSKLVLPPLTTFQDICPLSPSALPPPPHPFPFCSSSAKAFSPHLSHSPPTHICTQPLVTPVGVL